MEYEWSVLLTDWLLAVACGVMVRRIGISAHAHTDASYRIAGALVACAIAAFVGGIRHGSGPAMSDAVRTLAGYVSYVAIMLAGTLLLWGVLCGVAREPEYHRAYRHLCGFKFVILGSFFLIDGDPHWVALSWGADLSLVFLAGLYASQQWWMRDMGRWLLGGAAFSVIAGVIQQGFAGSHGTLGNNLFHLIQIPAVYCFARATMAHRDRPILRT